MSVVAAAVGPPGALAYGPQQLCGSGARKRKDVVLLQGPEAVVEEEEEESRPGDGDFLAAARQQQQQNHGMFVLERVDEEVEEERSSIGAASEEEGRDEDGEDEADSAAAGATTRRKKMPDDALACMDALDDALPIKRGLSNFFSGKSRSFANLQDAEVTSARDLAKPESPFNKRRRILRCSSIRRVASTSLTALPPFLPTAGNVDGSDSGGCG